MQSDELPLSDVINEEQCRAAFDKHGINFGTDEDSIYTLAITLWGLISQVFFKEENRSFKAAVMRIAALWAMLGKSVCDTNTGAYCRARLKVTFEAVADITRQLALSAETAFDRQTVVAHSLSSSMMRRSCCCGLSCNKQCDAGRLSFKISIRAYVRSPILIVSNQRIFAPWIDYTRWELREAIFHLSTIIGTLPKNVVMGRDWNGKLPEFKKLYWSK